VCVCVYIHIYIYIARPRSFGARKPKPYLDRAGNAGGSGRRLRGATAAYASS